MTTTLWAPTDKRFILEDLAIGAIKSAVEAASSKEVVESVEIDKSEPGSFMSRMFDRSYADYVGQAALQKILAKIADDASEEFSKGILQGCRRVRPEDVKIDLYESRLYAYTEYQGKSGSVHWPKFDVATDLMDLTDTTKNYCWRWNGKEFVESRFDIW